MEMVLDVRIVELPPMRVASVHAFGASPEGDAWRKLEAWAEPRGFMEAPGHRIFGFNNPSPSPGSPNYGYEFWMEVGPEVELEDGVKIKQFGGGLYAVTRCDLSGDINRIGDTWHRFAQWRESSPYRYDGSHQWLEEHISGGDPETLVLDLYMPVTE